VSPSSRFVDAHMTSFRNLVADKFCIFIAYIACAQVASPHAPDLKPTFVNIPWITLNIMYPRYTTLFPDLRHSIRRFMKSLVGKKAVFVGPSSTIR
jgi:hypothetical protein